MNSDSYKNEVLSVSINLINAYEIFEAFPSATLAMPVIFGNIITYPFWITTLFCFFYRTLDQISCDPWIRAETVTTFWIRSSLLLLHSAFSLSHLIWWFASKKNLNYICICLLIRLNLFREKLQGDFKNGHFFSDYRKFRPTFMKFGS